MSRRRAAPAGRAPQVLAIAPASLARPVYFPGAMRRLSPVFFALLAVPACTEAGPDPLAGTWQITRTVAEPQPDGCPRASLSPATMTVDPDADPQVYGSDGEGEIEEDGSIRYVTLEEVDVYDTLAGHRLVHDADTDTLVGEGTLGCAEGCDYLLVLTAERVGD